jgi:hypothetical protein
MNVCSGCSRPNEGRAGGSARRAEDVSQIIKVADGKSNGAFIIDDFHRLDDGIQRELANLIKTSAELWDADRYPKMVIVGINKV